MEPRTRNREPRTDPADTKPERDPFIDFVRVAAVVIVVAGHWLATTVIWEPGRIEGENALSVVSGSHLATWILQVMPLLFFVGGFSNSRSLRRHDGAYLAYLRTRYGRLLSPTLVFLGIWLVIGVVAQLLPLPQPNVLEEGADIAALPFWFIGIYVVVVALAPVMWQLHGRYGWWVPGAMVTGAVAVDVLHHGLGIPNIGVANYAFVWLFPHQLGFFYADARLRILQRAEAAAMALAGLAGLAVLTALAGYPTSMIGVPGEDRWNTDPPSLPLVMVALWLIGLALLARPAVSRWLQGEGPQWLTARLNRVPLTMYLWHVTAVTVAASILYPLGFPRAETGTAQWWAFRPVWLAALVAALVPLIWIFSRFEIHPKPARSTRAASPVQRIAASLAVTSMGLGLIGFGVTGFDRVLAQRGEEILGFTTNPAQNVIHVVVALALLRAAFEAGRAAALAAGAGSAIFLGLGLAALPEGIDLLAINASTAVLHIVVGAVFAGLSIFATARPDPY